MSARPEWQPRVVVCGSGFARVYLAALRRSGMPFELVGILARGSDRSRACAQHYQVPLYTDVEQVPDQVDIGCVVVGSAINGGAGAHLAQALMARGLHVLQEHPLHPAELAGCLRSARRHGVVYQVNTNYVHLDAVRCFVGAARRLLDRQPALFIDAVTSFQVLYTLVDILAAALGGLSPWSLSAVPLGNLNETGTGTPLLRSVDGTMCGVPTTLRIQNQLNPGERDNGGHIAHRITLGTEGGDLLLANTHGPVLWNPRLHMPADYQQAIGIDECPAAQLDLAATSYLTAPGSPTHREFIREDWPIAAGLALLELRRAILTGQDPLPAGQRHLAISRLVAEVTAGLGRPVLAEAQPPRIVEATELVRGPEATRTSRFRPAGPDR